MACFPQDGLELLVATPGRLAFLMARGGERAATTAREIAAYGASLLVPAFLGKTAVDVDFRWFLACFQ